MADFHFISQKLGVSIFNNIVNLLVFKRQNVAGDPGCHGDPYNKSYNFVFHMYIYDIMHMIDRELSHIITRVHIHNNHARDHHITKYQ